MFRVGQIHTYIRIYSVCTVMWAGKSPYIRSYTVYIHSSGQPYLCVISLSNCRVGQNHVYSVYIRYFWQGNYQTYGHIQCIYTVLANPKHWHVRQSYGRPSWQASTSKMVLTSDLHRQVKSNVIKMAMETLRPFHTLAAMPLWNCSDPFTH